MFGTGHPLPLLLRSKARAQEAYPQGYDCAVACLLRAQGWRQLQRFAQAIRTSSDALLVYCLTMRRAWCTAMDLLAANLAAAKRVVGGGTTCSLE